MGEKKTKSAKTADKKQPSKVSRKGLLVRYRELLQSALH